MPTTKIFVLINLNAKYMKVISSIISIVPNNRNKIRYLTYPKLTIQYIKFKNFQLTTSDFFLNFV